MADLYKGCTLLPHMKGSCSVALSTDNYILNIEVTSFY
jgi:hypothetical protein